MMKALLLDKKNQSQAPAPLKAVEESCVTCGGAHSYRNCPATDGNVYRDNIQKSYALSWKPCQGDSLNLPDHRIHKDGDGDASFQLKSDSLPHAHAQSTKTFYKHQDSRIMKAQELKTKTSAQTLIYKIFLQRYQVYQGRLLASFQDDAKYEHRGVKLYDVEKNDTMAPNADDAINKELVNLIRLDKFNVAADLWDMFVLKSNGRNCMFKFNDSCFAVMGWSSSLFVDYIADMKCLEEYGRDLILIGPSVIIMWLGSFLKINGSVEQEYNFEDIASVSYVSPTPSSSPRSIARGPLALSLPKMVEVWRSFKVTFFSSTKTTPSFDMIEMENLVFPMASIAYSTCPSDKEVYTSVLIKRFTHPVNIPKPPRNVVSSSSALANYPAFVRPSRTPTFARLGSALNIKTLVAAAERRETPIDETVKSTFSFFVQTLLSVYFHLEKQRILGYERLCVHHTLVVCTIRFRSGSIFT
ncbi:hypothetical protein Tco_0825505 [Tanacetum coccineum]